jgi:hypothetical protein
MTDSSKKRSFLSIIQVMPKDQLRHVAFFLIAIVMSISIIGIYLVSQINGMVNELSACAGEALTAHGQALMNLGFLFLILVILLVIYSGYNLILQKRLYGSLYSIERYVEKALKGEADGPLHHREGDSTKNLVNLISQLAEKSKK